MNMPVINVNGKEVVLVDKQVFLDLVYKTASEITQNKRRKICSLKEAIEYMGCGRTKFYQLLEDPRCLIKKSSVKGKYQIDSLERELARISK